MRFVESREVELDSKDEVFLLLQLAFNKAHLVALSLAELDLLSLEDLKELDAVCFLDFQLLHCNLSKGNH